MAQQEQDAGQACEVVDGRGGKVALDAPVPHAREVERLKVGNVLAGPVHFEVWRKGGDQTHEGVYLRE
jgi:hypothetical protein